MDEERTEPQELIGGPGVLTAVNSDDFKEWFEHAGREYRIYWLETPTDPDGETLPPLWAIGTDSEHTPGIEVWAFVEGNISLDELKDIIANSVKAEMIDEKPE